VCVYAEITKFAPLGKVAQKFDFKDLCEAQICWDSEGPNYCQEYKWCPHIYKILEVYQGSIAGVQG